MIWRGHVPRLESFLNTEKLNKKECHRVTDAAKGRSERLKLTSVLSTHVLVVQQGAGHTVTSQAIWSHGVHVPF